ncbi:MAG TPA: penicillin-insensitive murein endopeptidase [Solirubrobacteraceae bacterium]|nr:penicillin-insensitive murein endopeptidase [Solirubrobacteraceae bacterium]
MRGRAPGAIRGGIARESRTILFGGARRRRLTARLLMLAALSGLAGGAVAVAADPAPAQVPPEGAAPPPPAPDIRWRESRAIGQPWSGRLVRGVKLPAAGPDWFTWDHVLEQQPNRWWRRYGTDTLIRTLLDVVAEHRLDNPDAPRVGIGDLSRPRGGWFGKRYGGLGHLSHQNGLDVDIWYPRRDGLERRPFRVAQVDRELSQDLVDRFVAAGAVKVFVGPRLGLRGPRKVVVPLAHHDDHLHVRIPRP